MLLDDQLKALDILKNLTCFTISYCIRTVGVSGGLTWRKENPNYSELDLDSANATLTSSFKVEDGDEFKILRDNLRSRLSYDLNFMNTGLPVLCSLIGDSLSYPSGLIDV